MDARRAPARRAQPQGRPLTWRRAPGARTRRPGTRPPSADPGRPAHALNSAGCDDLHRQPTAATDALTGLQRVGCDLYERSTDAQSAARAALNPVAVSRSCRAAPAALPLAAALRPRSGGFRIECEHLRTRWQGDAAALQRLGVENQRVVAPQCTPPGSIPARWTMRAIYPSSQGAARNSRKAWSVATSSAALDGSPNAVRRLGPYLEAERRRAEAGGTRRLVTSTHGNEGSSARTRAR